MPHFKTVNMFIVTGFVEFAPPFEDEHTRGEKRKILVREIFLGASSLVRSFQNTQRIRTLTMLNLLRKIHFVRRVRSVHTLGRIPREGGLLA